MLCVYHTFSHREVKINVEVAGHYMSMGEPTKAVIQSQRLQSTVIDLSQTVWPLYDYHKPFGLWFFPNFQLTPDTDDMESNG